MAEVTGYHRIVNGKVVQVAAYAKKGTPSTTALAASWRAPGRPQMQATPGSFSGGRDIPGHPALIPDVPKPKKKPK